MSATNPVRSEATRVPVPVKKASKRVKGGIWDRDVPRMSDDTTRKERGQGFWDNIRVNTKSADTRNWNDWLFFQKILHATRLYTTSSCDKKRY